MTYILLYWNHICVLHRQEKAFLEDLAQRLRKDDIQLEVRYFGLGYPEHMSEYLARPDAILPDLIVSADLEVFEDLRIFSKFKSNLYPAADWVPLRQSPMLNAVQRGPCLLPFVSIPLVYYTREPEACAKTSLPDWRGLAFGGINNSAAKTVVKSVWERWGQVAAAKLLGESLVADMPIGAFQAVRQGQTSTALVPSLYALRADGRETFLRVPQEGPVLIPSYLCARASCAGVGSPSGGGTYPLPRALRFLCGKRGSDRLPRLHRAAQRTGGRLRPLSIRCMAGTSFSCGFLPALLHQTAFRNRVCLRLTETEGASRLWLGSSCSLLHFNRSQVATA